MRALIALLLIAIVVAQQISVIQTSKAGDSLKWSNTPPQSPVDFYISLDRTEKFQEVKGFGGAITQSAVQSINKMNPDLQREILSSYYGPDGIRYSIGRIALNSCDFSQGNYSYDPHDGDWDLSKFSISGLPDETEIIPFLQRIRDYLLASNLPPLKLFATPWSPPAWFKTNGKMDGSERPNGMYGNSTYLTTWANYYVKFLDAYKNAGIDDIFAFTIQNEVLQASFWEANCMSSDFQRDFLANYLGPTLHDNGYADTKIMIYDDQKYDYLFPEYIQTITNDSHANSFVAGVGVHWYGGPGLHNLRQVHEYLHNDQFMLATEACWEFPPNINKTDPEIWFKGEYYAYDIMGDLSNWVTGWTDWNIVLDQHGGPNHVNNLCDAPILADNENQKLVFRPMYYYMGQISKYVYPRSIRVETTSNQTTSSSYFGEDFFQNRHLGIRKNGKTQSELAIIDKVQHIGFTREDGRTVVILMNTHERSYTVGVKDEDDMYFSYTMEPRSIVTFVSEKR